MTRTAQLLGTTALVLLSCAPPARAQQAPPPTPSATTVLDTDVAVPSPAHVTVQSWALPEADHAPQAFPKRGYFIAHLLSGRIETTLDGQTAARTPDEYWSVGNDQPMTVRVLGQSALLETITPSAR
jgi:hypothetical protein